MYLRDPRQMGRGGETPHKPQRPTAQGSWGPPIYDGTQLLLSYHPAWALGSVGPTALEMPFNLG